MLLGHTENSPYIAQQQLEQREIQLGSLLGIQIQNIIWKYQVIQNPKLEQDSFM